jgi:hypothetical protein
MASGGMLLALCGLKPYINEGDNVDAVLSQMVALFCFLTVFIVICVICFHSKQTITLTLCVGLLSLSDERRQDWASLSNERPQDGAFGLSMKLTKLLILSYSCALQLRQLMASFELQKPGWLLIFFLAVALAAPFIMALRYLYRLIKVASNEADRNKYEESLFGWWRYFIHDKAPEAVGYAQSIFVGNIPRPVGVGNNPPPAVGHKGI